MPLTEQSSVSVSHSGSADRDGHASHTAVWVRGEHDIATRVDLMGTIAQSARLDDADVVVDLSGVTFMDASTIGVLVDAHSHLRARSRSLTVRAPSPAARRLLDICELTSLIDETAEPAQPAVAPALDSWVAVPAADRSADDAPPSAAQPTLPQDPAPVEAQRRLEPARSDPQRSMPS